MDENAKSKQILKHNKLILLKFSSLSFSNSTLKFTSLGPLSLRSIDYSHVPRTLLLAWPRYNQLDFDTRTFGELTKWFRRHTTFDQLTVRQISTSSKLICRIYESVFNCGLEELKFSCSSDSERSIETPGHFYATQICKRI